VVVSGLLRTDRIPNAHSLKILFSGIIYFSIPFNFRVFVRIYLLSVLIIFPFILLKLVLVSCNLVLTCSVPLRFLGGGRTDLAHWPALEQHSPTQPRQHSNDEMQFAQSSSPLREAIEKNLAELEWEYSLLSTVKPPLGSKLTRMLSQAQVCDFICQWRTKKNLTIS
jgi:hypothetical protein